MKPLALLLLSLALISCGSSDSTSYAVHLSQQKTIKTNAGAMAYSDQGQGKTIVLLHGVPTSSWLYRKVIPGLAKNHRVIAPDLIGFGSSAKPNDDGRTYTPAAQARRVRQLMKRLKIPRYTVLMHDMGGLVAWEMMHQDSQAIDNLVVLNTIVHKEGFNPPNMGPNFIIKVLSKAYKTTMGSSAILKLTFKSLGLTLRHKLSEAECHGYVQPLRQGSDKALAAFFSSLDQPLYDRLEQNKSVFRQFKGQTLILWGARDKILTTAQIPFLTQNLKVSKNNIHIYPAHDHFLAEENPSELINQVTRFLK